MTPRPGRRETLLAGILAGAFLASGLIKLASPAMRGGDAARWGMSDEVLIVVAMWEIVAAGLLVAVPTRRIVVPLLVAELAVAMVVVGLAGFYLELIHPTVAAVLLVSFGRIVAAREARR